MSEYDEEYLGMKKTPQFSEYIHWQELKDRILVINDGIDEMTVEDFIMPILKWNMEDDKADITEQFIGDKWVLASTVRKPITIYLNSPGGDIFVGLILAEVIKKSKTPINIVVLAYAASMGSVILVSGHKRQAYSYANILIHDGQTGVAGTSNKVKDHMKYIEKKNEQVKDFILANSKITEEKYDSMQDREWWISAQEALELGMIDEIL